MRCFRRGDLVLRGDHGRASDGGTFVCGFSSILETLLGNLIAIDYKAPLSNAQVAKMLETYGKFAKARPDAAATIMSRMFTILNELPADVNAGRRQCVNAISSRAGARDKRRGKKCARRF